MLFNTATNCTKGEGNWTQLRPRGCWHKGDAREPGSLSASPKRCPREHRWCALTAPAPPPSLPYPQIFLPLPSARAQEAQGGRQPADPRLQSAHLVRGAAGLCKTAGVRPDCRFAAQAYVLPSPQLRLQPTANSRCCAHQNLFALCRVTHIGVPISPSWHARPRPTPAPVVRTGANSPRKDRATDVISVDFGP